MALREYVQRQQIQQNLRPLEEVASDTQNPGLVREVVEQVAVMNADGLPGA